MNYNDTNGGLSASDVALLTGRNNNNDGFGNDGWWIILLLLALGGWNNGGCRQSIIQAVAAVFNEIAHSVHHADIGTRQ